MKILVFGNPLIKEDNLAIKIAKEINLPNAKFVICNSFNDILNYKGKEIIILDVVENINNVTLLKDINKLKFSNLTTHDFDLAFNLKLMQAIGKIKDITIIGIPQGGDKAKIKSDAIKIIRMIEGKIIKNNNKLSA